MTLTQILNDFQTAIANARGLIVAAHRQDATGAFLWTQSERVAIVEAAYMRVFISWETFLEQSFAAYMQGQPSISGTVFVRYSSPQNFQHSQDMLAGVARYVSWNRH